MRQTHSPNQELRTLLVSLKEKARDNKIWGRVAADLSKPSRQRRNVNVYKIEKVARDGETVVIPGKVLSSGELKKKVDVAAFSFSAEAKRKIEQAQGKVLTISQLLEQNPDGKKVRILG
ncbi:TPA: 50S ribosomal protein L18e [Candidatus Woesearchaeota archaeon]|nr:50S ribosomal protein L18e [Candidatus Woesearchaeota archaeon]